MHVSLGREAAIKVFHPHVWDDPAFRVRFRRDGTLAARPLLSRSSGFDDLDRAAAEAIAAAHFDPVPPELGVGRDEITVTLTSQWWNPMVR